MKKPLYKIQTLLAGLLLSVFSISLSAQDFHLELIDVLYETTARSQPITKFQADGNGGRAAFTIRHRTEGQEKKVVVWSFLNNIDIINIETGIAPDISSISFITDDHGSWDLPRWRTSKSVAKSSIKAEFSGKPSKQVKKYKKVISIWGQKGQTTKVSKNKGGGESSHLLEGRSRRFYPLEYTSFSIHFSTRGYTDYTDFLDLEVVYVFKIKPGPGKEK